MLYLLVIWRNKVLNLDFLVIVYDDDAELVYALYDDDAELVYALYDDDA